MMMMITMTMITINYILLGTLYNYAIILQLHVHSVYAVIVSFMNDARKAGP